MLAYSFIPTNFLTNLNLIRIILPGEIKVVIASSGGVGTTFLIRHLAAYTKTNHIYNDDGIKHSPIPPVALNSDTKFVFIFGNPKTAAVSLFRRNFHHLASIKSQKFKSHIMPIPQEMTLESYTAQGIDKFNFRDNFYNWYDKYLSVCPTLFIRYETLFDNVDALVEFLDLPQDCLTNFPKKKKRASSLEQLPRKIQQQLDQMYGDFNEELRKLNDVELRQRKTPQNLPLKFLKNPYLNALAEQPAVEFKLLIRQAQSYIRG